MPRLKNFPGKPNQPMKRRTFKVREKIFVEKSLGPKSYSMMTARFTMSHRPRHFKKNPLQKSVFHQSRSRETRHPLSIPAERPCGPL